MVHDRFRLASRTGCNALTPDQSGQVFLSRAESSPGRCARTASCLGGPMSYRRLLPSLLALGAAGLTACDNDTTQPNPPTPSATMEAASAAARSAPRITITRLSTLRGSASAISESGLIVGTLTSGNGWDHATVWKNGVATDLNP